LKHKGDVEVESVLTVHMLSKPSDPHKTLFLAIIFYGFLTETFSRSDYKGSIDRMLLHKEMERRWKEAVLTYFEVLFWHLPVSSKSHFSVGDTYDPGFHNL
jgi:hypothetical protein